MRVFIYEFVTGGGWWSVSHQAPSAGLLREGAAMLQAVTSDFAAIADVEVITLQDARRPVELPTAVEVISVRNRHEVDDQFQHCVASTDATLLIAPEIQGQLTRLATQVEQQGKRLISPQAKFCGVASDKWLTHLHWKRASVPRAESVLTPARVKLPSFLEYPLVIKPVDGCGSLGVQRLQSANDVVDWSDYGAEAIAQCWQAGRAVSVALLCGPHGNVCLPPCEQTLSDDGRLRYLGGRCPLPRDLSERAQRLALQAVAALPSTSGYVGVDLVLGDTPTDDVAIEVNPRLTTSYVGLRRLCRANLAEAMLAIGRGQPADISYHDIQVQFTASGECREI